mgnify:CR=1 FL=1
MSTSILKKTILIVEDELSLRNALCDKLTHEGFAVLEAKNGKEGLEVALREHPDLILLDLVMPKMDGMTMMKKLRGENEWSKTVPVIILTNLAGDNDQLLQDINETEPSYYIVKSNWKIEDVVAKIQERLDGI